MERISITSWDLSSAEVFEVIFQRPQQYSYEDGPLGAQADAPPPESPLAGDPLDVHADAAPHNEGNDSDGSERP